MKLRKKILFLFVTGASLLFSNVSFSEEPLIIENVTPFKLIDTINQEDVNVNVMNEYLAIKLNKDVSSNDTKNFIQSSLKSSYDDEQGHMNGSNIKNKSINKIIEVYKSKNRLGKTIYQGIFLANSDKLKKATKDYEIEPEEKGNTLVILIGQTLSAKNDKPIEKTTYTFGNTSFNLDYKFSINKKDEKKGSKNYPFFIIQ